MLPLATKIFIFTLAILSGSCAALRPPLHSPAGEETAPPLRLQAIRADANGLHLGIHADIALPGDELEIWRRLDHQDWALQQTVSIGTSLATSLIENPVLWTDPLAAAPQDLSYRLRLLRDDEQALNSPALDVAWTGWPAPPRLAATVDAATITLTWTPASPFELRLLRRDLLGVDDFQARAIIDPAAGARFLDDDLAPGAVVAYRAQFVDRRGPFPRFSPFSDPYYVTLD